MSDSAQTSVTSPALTSTPVGAANGLPHQSDLDLLNLGLIAKAVCSGLHVSKRKLDDILSQSVRAILSNDRAVQIDLSIDGQVTARYEGFARTAIFTGPQGAVLLPIGSRDVYFEPRRAKATPQAVPDLKVQRHSAFEEAAKEAFATEPDTLTAGVAILHKGALVAEKYAAGADADMPLEAWSMGKSLAAILLACAVSDGLIKLGEPLALKEWPKGDPRQSIRVEDALRMSSGVDFSATWSSDYVPEHHGYADHGLIYSGALDSRALVTSRLQKHEPGSFGAYKNSDTLLLMAALEDRLETAGLDPLKWPYERLLGPLGTSSILLETDPYGHFLITGYIYGTPRDWTRLGQIFIDQDLANALEIDWPTLQACLQPSPSWAGQYWMADAPKDFDDSIYGGQVWLNRHAPQDRWPAPDDTAFFLGVGGQYTFMIPSLDLVVVRMGHIRGILDTNAGRGHVPALLRSACEVARSAL
ncbi:MAG: serine hydrolase [Pseudomonadota bacterium]